MDSIPLSGELGLTWTMTYREIVRRSVRVVGDDDKGDPSALCDGSTEDGLASLVDMTPDDTRSFQNGAS